MTRIYVAKFSRGKPNLIRVRVTKGTPKTYVIARSDRENLLGWQTLPERLLKGNYHCFSTAEEALEYLLSETNKHIAKLEGQLEETKKVFAELAETLEALLAREGWIVKDGKGW